ncbi:MAG: DUF3817 domain-containing protein [Micrococcus sp.]|nr:DUF3817 domain-containing protein [Micrococcus sp.]
MTAPGPRPLFTVTAIAEVITWAMLITAMILRAADVTDALVRPAGGIHGFVFLCYVVVVIAVWIDGRWSIGRGLLALASAIVPFMTVPFERAMARRGVPEPQWRVLRDDADRPLDRLLASVLTRPVISAVIAIAAVSIVFALLLAAGPPTQWFS